MLFNIASAFEKSSPGLLGALPECVQKSRSPWHVYTLKTCILDILRPKYW